MIENGEWAVRIADERPERKVVGTVCQDETCECEVRLRLLQV